MSTPTRTTGDPYLRSYLGSALETLKALPLGQVEELIAILEQARSEGQQVFVCGNGGSAATASHLANDLGKGASFGRERRFRVLALTDNVPWITALANDVDYSQIFVEQLKNFARPNDVLIAFSGSGTSPNVVEAMRWGRDQGLITVGITGRSGGALVPLSTLAICVPSDHMGRIEDAHFVIQHLVGYHFMENAPAVS